MKIGIDVQSLSGKKTGIGYYLANLLHEFESMKNIDLVQYSNHSEKDLSSIDRVLWENIHLPQLIRAERPDILHIPGFAGPMPRSGTRRVTTVHDLIGMIYPQNLGLMSRFYWQKWLPACIKKSDFIIADSFCTKKDIINLLKVPKDKIAVIYLAADSKFQYIQDKNDAWCRLNKRLLIDSPFILSVSTIEPRKNFISLVKAYSKLESSIKEKYKLIIAGKKSWGFPQLESAVCKMGLEKNIVFLDYINQEELILLYNCATAFVFCSYYEGFGLSLLEAFSCGCPVISSNVSSLPEVAGKAAVLVDPDNVDIVKSSIAKMIQSKDMRIEFSEKGKERAKAFNWHLTAEKTVKVYKNVLE